MARKYIITASACLLSAACTPASEAPDPMPTPVSAVDRESEGWLSFEVVGQGPDVILLPGLASDAEVWRSTVDELSGQYRFHMADVAGFAGNPVGAPREAIISGLAGDLAAYMDVAQLKQPVLVGHSMGGLTALTTALDHADKVSAVISVDNLSFYPLIFNPAATVATARPMADGMRAQMQALSKADYDAMQARNSSIYAKSPGAVARIIDWGQASDRGVVLAALGELMTTDLRPDLPNISVPVTVIYAYDERMGRPSAAIDTLYESAYAGLPDLTLTRVDGSFHFIMDDQPVAFITSLSTALDTYTQR